MAVDLTDGVNYFMCADAEHKDYLGVLRHWNNLKIGFEDALVWVKDLTAMQVSTLEVKSIPAKKIFYASGHQLFPQGSLLPARNIPSLLWTSIETGLPVRLPSFNHNYFGIPEKVAIRLVASGEEQEAWALLVTMETLKAYMEAAPAVRLKNLGWALVENGKAIVTGTPLLPLSGEVFWRSHDFLISAGYAPELHALSGTLNTLLNPEGEYWIVWSRKGDYWKLNKGSVVPLSVSSFRLSIKQ